MSNTMYDVVIVGGGPAALSAAWHLRDFKTLVLEQSDRLGGRLKSDPRGDYWLNFGGHLFPGADSHLQEMTRGLGLETIEIPGLKTAMAFGGKVYRSKHVEAYPIVLPLSFRERYALAVGGLKVMRHVRAWHKEKEERPGESEAARRARLAAYLSDRSFRDVLGQLPDRVDAIFRSAGRRAGAELNEQTAGVGVALFGFVWSGGKSTMALNLKGGSGRLGEAFQRLLGDSARCNATVTSVEQVGDHVAVSYRTPAGDERVRARQVIVTVAATLARRIVRGLAPALDEALASIAYGPFVGMSMLTTETGPMPWDDIYAMTTPGMAFDMWFNHANPLRGGGPRRPGGSLMCYASGAPGRALLTLSDSEIEQRFRTDLYRLFPELRDVISEAVVYRWELGQSYRQPGASFQAMVEHCLKPGKTVHFAGDYFGDCGNMEAAAGAGAEAAAAVRAELS